MKIHLACLLFVVAGVGSVGAGDNGGLTLAPVGPAAVEKPSAGTNGTLVVYSAFDSSAHFGGIPQHLYHTDYRLCAEDGHSLRTVHNDSGTVVPGPTAVVLAPGNYRVIAQANGYGKVTVPVVVRSGLTTMVHLEGGGNWKAGMRPPIENAVLLPSGQRAGWSASVAAR